jgi:hypothetical protein
MKVIRSSSDESACHAFNEVFLVSTLNSCGCEAMGTSASSSSYQTHPVLTLRLATADCRYVLAASEACYECRRRPRRVAGRSKGRIDCIQGIQGRRQRPSPPPSCLQRSCPRRPLVAWAYGGYIRELNNGLHDQLATSGRAARRPVCDRCCGLPRGIVITEGSASRFRGSGTLYLGPRSHRHQRAVAILMRAV